MLLLLASAEAAPSPFADIRILLVMGFWVSAIAVCTLIPVGLVWGRNHRFREFIVAGALLVGIIASASALQTITARDHRASEEAMMLQSGYYDPAEHQHDPPAFSWGLWTALGGMYVVLLVAALAGGTSDELPHAEPPGHAIPPSASGGGVKGRSRVQDRLPEKNDDDATA
jgi:hypothetical protein